MFFVKRISKMKIFLWIFAATLVVYFAACSYVSSSKSKAFALLEVGDSEGMAIRLLGKPSVREKPGAPFSRYASEPCQKPCEERVWFENRLSFDTEAWSVELDSSGQVIHKAHWRSP